MEPVSRREEGGFIIRDAGVRPSDQGERPCHAGVATPSLVEVEGVIRASPANGRNDFEAPVRHGSASVWESDQHGPER